MRNLLTTLGRNIVPPPEKPKLLIEVNKTYHLMYDCEPKLFTVDRITKTPKNGIFITASYGATFTSTERFSGEEFKRKWEEANNYKPDVNLDNIEI